MASEEPARGLTVHVQAPPCDREFMVHYRDGEPICLVIDGRPYGVKARRRGTNVRDGDLVVVVVEHPRAG